jgi:predicted nucleic acid-binding protein
LKILLDTNILFSAIIKSDGIIAELILSNKLPQISFYGCYFSYIELFKYKEKMLNASKLKEVDFLEIMYAIIKRVTFLNEDAISTKNIEKAFKLTKDVDEKDTIFVAMCLHLNCTLWTGDKQLINGLKQKKYEEIITTNDLINIIANK